MADITDQNDQQSPGDLDDSQGNGAVTESRGVKRQRQSAANDDDDDDDEKGGRERRKIEIKFISDKSRRHITFSKRKAGIMKKVSRRVSIQQSPSFNHMPPLMQALRLFHGRRVASSHALMHRRPACIDLIPSSC